MDYVALIPRTPRTVRNPPEPEPQSRTICERALDILQPVIFKALRPALLQFNQALST